MRVVSRSVIVAVAVALMAVAGCDTQGDPAPPPPSQDALTTTTPSDDVVATSDAAPTTAEPTEADGLPEMPEEAKEKTEAGAEAFVEYYVSAFNYGYESGDPDGVARLSAPGCLSCGALTGLVSEPSEISDYLTVENVRGVLLADAATVQTDLKQSKTSSSPAMDGTAIFDLLWQDEWKVREITVQADG